MSNAHLIIKSGFPRSHIGNGIGRYVGQLQRLTIKFCKHHGSSRGARDYIENELVNFAKENPGVVVYLKPRRHRSAVLKAEYLNGRYAWFNIDKFSQEHIVKYMELLKTQQEDTTNFRLRKFQHTEFPSIQGPWNPFASKDPKLNIVKFPSEEFGHCKQFGPTATESLAKLFQAQQLNLSEEEYERPEMHDVRPPITHRLDKEAPKKRFK